MTMLVGFGSREAQIILQPSELRCETLCYERWCCILCSDPARTCITEISALMLQRLPMAQMPRPWSLLICCSQQGMPQQLYVMQSCERHQVTSCCHVHVARPLATGTFSTLYLTYEICCILEMACTAQCSIIEDKHTQCWALFCIL